MRLLDMAFGSPLIRECLSASPLVYVDVGAAMGVEEPWLAMVRDPKLTRVVAFEPHPESLATIPRLQNGTYHQMAIGSVPGTTKFYLHGTRSSLQDRSKGIGKTMPTMDVQVETLARLRE